MKSIKFYENTDDGDYYIIIIIIIIMIIYMETEMIKLLSTLVWFIASRDHDVPEPLLVGSWSSCWRDPPYLELSSTLAPAGSTYIISCRLWRP